MTALIVVPLLTGNVFGYIAMWQCANLFRPIHFGYSYSYRYYRRGNMGKNIAQSLSVQRGSNRSTTFLQIVSAARLVVFHILDCFETVRFKVQ